jgi:hypothetical protein
LKNLKNGLRPLLLGLALFAAGHWTLPAREGARRGDYLKLKIAVMGAGDNLYFWWGHIALIVEDELSGQNRFYDYGIFSFEADHFFVNFAMGRLLYRCGVSPAEPNINHYINTNRDVVIYTLDLPPHKKEEVYRFVENNVLPENRNYYYHHFNDNCATRIRDLIDMAVYGQFKEKYGGAGGRFTLREHIRRFMWFSPFMDWLLNFLMGQDIDVPITVWDEMFLPSEIGARIAEFYYADSQGIKHKLVSDTAVINKAVNRPAPLDAPPAQWPGGLAAGLLLAAVFTAALALRKKKPNQGRAVMGITQAAFGIFFGFTGSVLFFMTFFSNHDYTYHNANVLFVNPLMLAAVPLGILCAAGKKPGQRLFCERLLRALWTYVFFGGLLSVIIKLSPAFWQTNLVTQLLIMPPVFVLSFIPLWIERLVRRKKA